MVGLDAIAAMVAPLFVPGDRPDRFAKAMASGADAVIIDLEDAVAPAAKESARDNLPLVGSSPVPIIIRVNGRGTPWHDADIAAVMHVGSMAMMVPKSEDAHEIAALANRIGVPLIALIESGRGLAEARAIGAASARLAFGSIDFCADLGCRHTHGALLMARSEIVLAARLAERPKPIDGVTMEIGDVGRLRLDAAAAREVGFAAKLCVHPDQVPVVIEAFAPTPEDVNWAQRILQSAGSRATSIEGMMVDAPVRALAKRVLAEVSKQKRRSTHER